MLWFGKIDERARHTMRSEIYFRLKVDIEGGFSEKDMKLISDHSRILSESYILFSSPY